MFLLEEQSGFPITIVMVGGVLLPDWSGYLV